MQRILLAAALAAPLFTASIITAGITAGAARADSVTLHGSHLVFTSATDNDTSIETDTSLQGAIRLNVDDASCLITHEGADIVVDTSSCGSNLGHLTIDVPQHLKLTVNIQDSGNVTIGNTEGDLAATISGNGDLHAGRVNSLLLMVSGSGDSSVQTINGAADIDSAGNGDIRLGELNGPLNSRQTSSGDLIVGHIGSPAVNIVQSSNGDAVIGNGGINVLRANLTGSGDLAVAATVNTADLRATDGGDIHIAQVTGAVQRHASGGSDISTNGLGVGGELLSKLSSIGATGLAASGHSTIHISDDDGGTDIDIGNGTIHHHSSSSGGSGFGHFLAGVAVLFLLYVVWRAVQRRGGVNVVSSQIRARSSGGAAPTHPGVIAVRDKLAELEAKLARVEMYVTNREFDLHRKFRELDT